MTLDEVLGRGGGELPSLSSSGGEGEKWPTTAGRLSFHAVLVLVGVAVSSGRSGGREFLWMALTVERLEPRLCVVTRSGFRRNVEVELELEDAGLCARALETGADGRREEKVRCRLRRGEGAWKMPWELRDLRGVLVGVSDLALDWTRGTRVSETARNRSRARDTYLRDMRVPAFGHAFSRLRLTYVGVDKDVTVHPRDTISLRLDQRGRARLRVREIREVGMSRDRRIVEMDVVDGGGEMLLVLDPLVGPA